MISSRRFSPADTAQLVDVCLRTADNGSDATGLIFDDRLWADLFLLPYLKHDPDLTSVLEMDGRAVGYMVATADTTRFERWFREIWWPKVCHRYPQPTAYASTADHMVAYGYSRGLHPVPQVDSYPAHLHMDLLPEAQGAGWGRRLIQELEQKLRLRKVDGLHAIASTRNAGAIAFYARMGFTPLPPLPGAQPFGISLSAPVTVP